MRRGTEVLKEMLARDFAWPDEANPFPLARDTRHIPVDEPNVEYKRPNYETNRHQLSTVTDKLPGDIVSPLSGFARPGPRLTHDVLPRVRQSVARSLSWLWRLGRTAARTVFDVRVILGTPILPPRAHRPESSTTTESPIRAR